MLSFYVILMNFLCFSAGYTFPAKRFQRCQCSQASQQREEPQHRPPAHGEWPCAPDPQARCGRLGLHQRNLADGPSETTRIHPDTAPSASLHPRFLADGLGPQCADNSGFDGCRRDSGLSAVLAGAAWWLWLWALEGRVWCFWKDRREKWEERLIKFLTSRYALISLGYSVHVEADLHVLNLHFFARCVIWKRNWMLGWWLLM